MKFIDTVTHVLLYVGILGIAGIVLGNWLVDSELWKKVIEGIGIGLIVASLVGMSVERYTKQQMWIETNRMVKEIRTNVFRASLGSQFPDSLWVQIWNHLMLRPVLRKEVALDYQLELLEGYADFLNVQVCWSYRLCNLNPITRQEYPFVAALDKPFHQELSPLTKFTDIKVNGASVLSDCCIEETSTEVICRTIISLAANEEKQVLIRGITALRRDQVIPHSMVDPSEDLEISVLKPEGIDLALDPLHPREDRLTEIPTASEDRRCWRIAGGILPGHGVCLRWYPSFGVSSRPKQDDSEGRSIGMPS